MRAVTVAFAAVPVLLGGLGLALVAGGINPLDPSSPASEDTPISPATPPDGAPLESETGTLIDGQRPHLSVIDGRVKLFLPVPLPEIISLLPGGETDLNPLPPPRHSDDGSSSLPHPVTGERQTAPGAGAAAGSGPRPDARPAPGPAQPQEPRAGERPAVSAPWAPGVPAITPPEPGSSPPRADGGPSFDRDLLNKKTGESLNHGRPPHADIQGRPPHAGQTGPPGHSNGNRNNNGNGPPGHAVTGNRPDHAGTTGRPDHAAGGTPKSDDSRPGKR